MARPRSNRPDARSDRPGGGPPRRPGGSSSGGPRRPTGEGRPPRRDDGPPRERRSFQSSEGRPPRRDDGPPRERRSFQSSEGRPPRRDDRRDDRGPDRRDDRGPARRDDGPPRERRSFQSGEGRPPRRDDRRDDRGPDSRDDRGPARRDDGPPRERRSFQSSEGRPPRRDDRRDDRGPARPGRSFQSSEGGRPPRRDSAAAPRRRTPRLEPLQAEGPERLQKILAQAGVGSRRACELLILEGRVTVDGQTANELGAKFDPATAKIAVDGQKIQPEKFAYYLVYKPKGYVSTSSDPSGRPLVQDLIPKAKERIFIVGRLDRHSEGLMLLTNDGAMAQRLTHPKFGVEKTYRVTVAGEAGNEIVQKLTDGVWLAEGKVRARRAKVVSKRGNATVLEVVLAEGKNREIRRMLARLDHKVLSLLRVSIGPLQLKGLSEGAWRSLSESEVERLRSGDLFSDEGERSPGEARRPQRDRAEPREERRFEPRPSSRFGSDEPRRDRRDDRRDDRPARPARPRYDEEAEGGDEEVVFTDRMEAGGGDDRPNRSMQLDSHRDRPPSGRGGYDRGPGRGRPEGRGEGRPPRGPGRDRDRAPSGRPTRDDGPQGRSFDRQQPPRDDRPAREGRPPRREGGSPDQRRTILGGSARESSPPKRRSGPGKGLPPRRRKPS